MDRRLLSYYNRELQYLRELGGEFARQFPKIAGRLGLEAFECADPYVERLLEGFAFLAARVQLKIDSEFPRFTEHLLSLAYPHYLAPTPSMAIVKVTPNHRQGQLDDGYSVPRGSALRSHVGRGDQTACEYRTGHDVTLWPIELVSVEHVSNVGKLHELKLPGKKRIQGAVKFRFRTLTGVPFKNLTLDNLALFVAGPEQFSLRIYELLLAGAQALVVRAPNSDDLAVVLDNPVCPVGFEDEQALLPFGAKSFQGYRLLHEYFSFPTRFQFVQLTGLRTGIARCAEPELEVVVLLDRHEPFIESAIGAANFELFCTPAINLFPKQLDRIHLNERQHEYHVIADRTRPRDFEVHSLTEVEGVGTRAQNQQVFRPFYASRERSEQDSAYYTIHREVRITSEREKRDGPRSTYSGSELFIALVNREQGPFLSDLRQLSIAGLCTNRDLPLTMSVGAGPADFYLDSGAPVDTIRCIAGPSEPRPPTAWGASSWRLVSHLSLNYLSITDNNPEAGAAALRQLLQLYGEFGAPSMSRQIEGVRSVTSASIVRRIRTPGPLAFGRGVEITLDCDESAFEGGSAFLFSAVLDRFFAKHASLNSFTELVFKSAQRGESMRWPPRIGRRAIT
jgi:type VI secretion system protein ImpG